MEGPGRSPCRGTRRGAWTLTAMVSCGRCCRVVTWRASTAAQCEGPLNGPTATGTHCGEGWTLYPLPGPQLQRRGRLWERRLRVLQLHRSLQPVGRWREHSARDREPIRSECWRWWTASFSTFRVPYPLGSFYGKGLDGRIDDRQHRLEGPCHLDDLGQPSPVPRGRRHGKSGSGLQVPSTAGPAGALVGFPTYATSAGWKTRRRSGEAITGRSP